MKAKTGKIVIVLGMHRSGTSMIGGVLTRLGVDMGEDSPGKQESNPLGHFEDRAFLELNQEILTSAAGSWDNPPDPQNISVQGEKYSSRINDLVRSRISEHPGMPWGWKDPRTSLTIGLYSPVLENPYILWCQRDPELVAKSLEKRNQFTRAKSFALTRVYQDRIKGFLAANQEIPVLELCYQTVVNDPRIWIDKIVDFLELQPSAEQIQKAITFVLPEEELSKRRKNIRWKNWISLPLRAVKKAWRVVVGNQSILDRNGKHGRQ